MKVIFVDANIYLRFFDSNQPGFKKLLDFLLRIEKNLFITSQIVDEVERNKLTVFKNSIANYESKIKIDSVLLPEHFAMDSNSFDIINWNRKRKELEDTNSRLGKEVEAIFAETVKKISSSSDSVSIKLRSIFKNQIRASEEEFVKAKKRKEIGNPPGKHSDPLGDQISWEQFLNRVRIAEEASIISNDFDYFIQYDEGIYLNAFLHSELLGVNPHLKVNCFCILAEFAKSHHENVIGKEELDEISKEERLFKRIVVDSSNISSIGYDKGSNTLEIEFQSGAVYQYFDVPLNVHQGIMAADSKGQYFAQHIKGYYRFVKV